MFLSSIWLKGSGKLLISLLKGSLKDLSKVFWESAKEEYTLCGMWWLELSILSR